MINQADVQEINELTELYEKNWGVPLDFTSIPSTITQEKLCLILKRIVKTGESIIVGYKKVLEISVNYSKNLNWNDCTDGDILSEPCPFCGGVVKVLRYGEYDNSSVVYCETPNCMKIECRGL